MKRFGKFQIICFLVFVGGLFPLLGISGQEKNYSTRGFSLSWNIQGNNLVMTLSAKTTGWISVGFEPGKVMEDADIIMVAVDKNGNVTAEDHYGVSKFGHKKDTDLGGADNITVISGSETNGITTVTFSVPLSSGDKYDKVLMPGKKVKVIFAAAKDDKFSSKHNKKGEGRITL